MHVLAAMRTTLDDDGTLTGPLEGELVVLPLFAAGRDDVGLYRRESRTFVGVDSHADISSVEVVELDVTPHVVMGHVRESLSRRGSWQEDHLVDTAARLTAEMLSVAQQFPVGTILQKDGPLLQAQIPVIDRGGRRPVCDPAHGGGGLR
jgi:hypothetical protein